MTLNENYDTSYIEPILTKNSDLNNIPKNYKEDLLNRINYFIDGLNTDFENGDYNSNYTGYISLIETYISQLELLTKTDSSINIDELKNKLSKIKKNQLITKVKQAIKNVEAGRGNEKYINSDSIKNTINELKEIDQEKTTTLEEEIQLVIAKIPKILEKLRHENDSNNGHLDLNASRSW